MCAGLWWTMNVSDVESERERDTMCMHVCAGAGVHAHFLHASFFS